jgi:3-hydroxybutyryl-CoA dehydratase
MASPRSQKLAFADLAVGGKASFEFSVSDADMARFAELSGDFNPLHIDDAFAREKKFEGKVVYGALIIAKVSRLIGMELPGQDSVWTNVNFQFNRPLYVGQAATLEGVVTTLSEATGFVELKLTLKVDGRTLGKGTAEVLLVGR